MFLAPETQSRNLLRPEEAAARLGYTSREAFVRSARRMGLRRIRLNARVIRYDPEQVDLFLRQRGRGV